MNANINESPIQAFYKQSSAQQISQIQINEIKIQRFDIFNEAINIMIDSRIQKT